MAWTYSQFHVLTVINCQLVNWGFPGWKAIKGALAIPLMVEGHKKGLMIFAVITCRKPLPNILVPWWDHSSTLAEVLVHNTYFSLQVWCSSFFMHMWIQLYKKYVFPNGSLSIQHVYFLWCWNTNAFIQFMYPSCSPHLFFIFYFLVPFGVLYCHLLLTKVELGAWNDYEDV